MKDKVAIIVSVVLLACIAGEKLTLLAPAEASTYHERVRAAAKTLPLRIGDWAGKEVEVPPAAVKLLRPNVIISREFVNESTGRRASFLLVQCDDTRELVAHYPPVCYPGRGYQLLKAESQATTLKGVEGGLTEYRFVRQSFDDFSSLVVAHFIVMPDGQVRADMDAMRSAAARVQNRFFGAAQVQVAMDGSVPERERREVVATLIEGHRTLIDAILRGASRPAD